jgi:ABC-type antimicrobial peptide transport system permease subunit
MLKNYIKITVRSLMKSKIFVFINIIGMGLALACCVVAYLNYKYAYGFDSDQLNRKEIYRIDFTRVFEGRSRDWGITPLPLGTAIKENIPELEEVVRYHPTGGNIRIEEDLFNTNITYVDEKFFEVFSFPLKYGNSNELSDPSKIFISENLAAKYFGNEDPVGRQITQVLDSGKREYVVAGVIARMQSNSSFTFVESITNWANYKGTYPNLDENNWGAWSTVFLKISDPSRIKAIEGQLQQYVEPQNLAREDFKVTSYYIEPFDGMAERTREKEMDSYTREGLPTPAAIVPAIMAVLILLIACFNFTNTSIAISGRRLKEIGLRKVMGGRRKQLVIQFLAENIALCLIAMIAGLLMAEYLVPKYSQMWEFLDIELSYVNNVGFFGFLFVLLLFAGLVAGSYPAFYISRFDPTRILKGTAKFGGAGAIPKLLLGLQYVISMLAIIMGIAFVQNARYQEELDLGFDKAGVIYTYVNNFNEFEIYRNALAENPDIEVIAGSEYQLYSSGRNDPVRYEDKQIETDILHVGDDYLKAMSIDIIEGRSFAEDSETDRLESILVSPSFISQIGWTDNPIGKRIVWADTISLYVIGVVKDIYTNGLWDELDPMIIRYVPEKDYRFLTVKTSAMKILEVNEFMKDKWNEIFPTRLYSGRSLDEVLRESAEVNENIIKMFLFLGIIATILSATGLFTLVSLTIIRRMKEIGVRKVLGASVVNIAKNLNRQFFIILVIAAILGSVLGSYMGSMLMDSIWKYYVAMNIPSAIISVLLMLLISLITVGFKVYNAAMLNPVNTLRSE